MDSLWQFFLAAVGIGYLIGSIPFGLVLTRLAGLGDVREIGSGNIGATNVLRTGSKTLAAATLVLDGGKGALALAFVAGEWGLGWGSGSGLIAGIAAVLGHNFPVWLKFKGGKGGATTLGILLVAFWPVGVAACATWLLVAGTLRISSLAALVALAASPVYAYGMGNKPVALAAAILALLSIIRHHANIKRMLNGEEPKIRG
jgi:glycerol-3-phosphate acyltransferase PlsY